MDKDLGKVMDGLASVKENEDRRFKFNVLDYNYVITYKFEEGIFDISKVEKNKISDIHKDEGNIVDNEYIDTLIKDNFLGVLIIKHNEEEY